MSIRNWLPRGPKAFQIALTGYVGEKAAESWLKKNDFRYRRADNIFSVGHTLMPGKSLPEFECKDLHQLADRCRRTIFCEVKDKPCIDKGSIFFQRTTRLSQFNRGKKCFNFYCSNHMSFAVRRGKCLVCVSSPCAIKAYLLIDEYIRNFYFRHGGKKRKGRYKKDSFWNGHPGRIDYVAVKDGELMCIEAKANTSELSRWQAIRLEWMKRHGFKSYVMHVSFKLSTDPAANKTYREAKSSTLLRVLNPICVLKEFDVNKHPQFLHEYPIEKQVEYYNRPRPWDRLKEKWVRKKRKGKKLVVQEDMQDQGNSSQERAGVSGVKPTRLNH